MTTLPLPDELWQKIDEMRLKKILLEQLRDSLKLSVGQPVIWKFIDGAKTEYSPLHGVKIIPSESCPDNTILFLNQGQLVGWWTIQPDDEIPGEQKVTLTMLNEEHRPHPPYQGGYPRGSWTWDKIDCPGGNK